VLGPKQTTWGDQCNYSDADLDRVKDKGYHLYIAAVVDYFDIFDAHHRTEACLEVINLNGTYVRITTPPTGSFKDVDMLPQAQLNASCERNCADKECDKP
jgi:hypothetical protein